MYVYVHLRVFRPFRFSSLFSNVRVSYGSLLKSSRRTQNKSPWWKGRINKFGGAYEIRSERSRKLQDYRDGKNIKHPVEIYDSAGGQSGEWYVRP